MPNEKNGINVKEKGKKRMQEKPFFSIITPVYNCEAYIEECILSLKAQTYDNFEHIIIDGGSTDATMDIVRKYEGTYPMRYVSEKDKGMYDAINKGFAMAKGNIFSWLNADDRYVPQTLEIVSAVFEEKDVQWLTGIPTVCMEMSSKDKTAKKELQYIMTDRPFVYARSYLKAGYYEGRLLGFIQQESTFWSRELWERTGGIPATYQYAGDHFLWKSFAKYAPLYTVNAVLANFRIHTGQKTTDMDKYYGEIGRKTIKFKLLRRPLLFSLHFYQMFFYKKRMIDVRKLSNWNLQG